MYDGSWLLATSLPYLKSDCCVIVKTCVIRTNLHVRAMIGAKWSRISRYKQFMVAGNRRTAILHAAVLPFFTRTSNAHAQWSRTHAHTYTSMAHTHAHTYSHPLSMCGYARLTSSRNCIVPFVCVCVHAGCLQNIRTHINETKEILVLSSFPLPFELAFHV